MVASDISVFGSRSDIDAEFVDILLKH